MTSTDACMSKPLARQNKASIAAADAVGPTQSHPFQRKRSIDQASISPNAAMSEEADVASQLLASLITKANTGTHYMRTSRYMEAIDAYSVVVNAVHSTIKVIESTTQSHSIPGQTCYWWQPQQQHHIATAAGSVAGPPSKRAKLSDVRATQAATGLGTPHWRQQPQQRSNVNTRVRTDFSRAVPTKADLRSLVYTRIDAGRVDSSHGFLYQEGRMVSLFGFGRKRILEPRGADTLPAFRSLHSVTVYNMALAHHLQAETLSSDVCRRTESRSHLASALKLYERAYVLYSQLPKSEMQEDVSRAMGIMSNVGILYSELGNREQSDRCWRRLLEFILRLSVQQATAHNSRRSATGLSTLAVLESSLGSELDMFFTNVAHLYSLRDNVAAAA